MRDWRNHSCRDAVPDRHRVPAFLLGRGEVWEEDEGKQDKGNVSQTSPCDCLHIVFSRDTALTVGDTFSAYGGNPPFPAGNREIPDVCPVPS